MHLKNVIEQSVSVPGVQTKLSISLVKKNKDKSDTRLTVVGALKRCLKKDIDN